MFEFLNILTVIDKEYLLNIKKKKEEKIVKRFFIIYSIVFTFTCLLIIITNCVPFILLLFIFYFSLFRLSPIDGYLDYNNGIYSFNYAKNDKLVTITSSDEDVISDFIIA